VECLRLETQLRESLVYRYDELVGQFSSKTVPCVGMSVGVERVFTVLERKAVKQAEQLDAGIRESRTQVGLRSGYIRPALFAELFAVTPWHAIFITTEGAPHSAI